MKTSKIYLPDTNVIIRYLVSDNQEMSIKAKDFFDKVKNGIFKAKIIESVIAECIYILIKIYKVPKDEAAKSLIDVLQYKGITNEDRNELINALNIFTNKRLDIVDCILYAKADNKETDVFTFDNQLIKALESKKY